MHNPLKEWLQVPDTQYSTRQIVWWLWAAWQGNRLQATLNAVVGLLQVGASLAAVWAVQRAIDIASHVVPGNIYWAVAVMAGLILIDFALSIASIWIQNILGIRAQNRMQQRMLDRILRSEWHGKETHHSGDVLNRLETDVATVVTFLTQTLPSTISTLTMFLGAFFYLSSMDWRLALIVVIMIPLFVLVSKIYVRQMRQLTHKVRQSDSKVQSVLQETIQHRMLIKTLESDTEAVEKLEQTQSELRRHVVRRTRFSVFSNLVLNFGFAAGYLVAFTWAAFRMSAGTLTFGGMTAFLQLVNRIQSPARQLTKLVPAFVGVLTAVERLMELEEDPLEEQGEPIELSAPCGVRFSDVSFAYEKADGNIINRLTFDFRPGSCTAILGETGAGKTTLVRLILALLHPEEGEVTLYNKVKELPMSPRMRTNFVYVPQGNTLLSGTIRENLLLGKPTATDEELDDALRQACADFVFQLPQGINTSCSEQGGGLSEGQAQRISIARALLRGRSIMLFDEATSALDPATERRLLENILARQDKTVIFITHRPAVVDYCSQTLRLRRAAGQANAAETTAHADHSEK